MLATATRPVTVPSPRAGEAPREHDLLAVRAWARSVGYPIDETCGVPLSVLKTYRRVHGC